MDASPALRIAMEGGCDLNAGGRSESYHSDLGLRGLVALSGGNDRKAGPGTTAPASVPWMTGKALNPLEAALNVFCDRLEDIACAEEHATYDEVLIAVKLGTGSNLFRRLCAMLANEIVQLNGLSNPAVPVSPPFEFDCALANVLYTLKYAGEKCLDSSVQARINLLDFLAGEVQAGRMVAAQAFSAPAAVKREPMPEEALGARLRAACEALGVVVPEAGPSAAQLVLACKAKVEGVLPTLPALPLLDRAAFTAAQLAEVAAVGDAFREEYVMRRKALLERFDVTLDSFLESSRVKGKEAEIRETVDRARHLIGEGRMFGVADLFKAGEEVAAIQRPPGGASQSARALSAPTALKPADLAHATGSGGEPRPSAELVAQSRTLRVGFTWTEMETPAGRRFYSNRQFGGVYDWMMPRLFALDLEEGLVRVVEPKEPRPEPAALATASPLPVPPLAASSAALPTARVTPAAPAAAPAIPSATTSAFAAINPVTPAVLTATLAGPGATPSALAAAPVVPASASPETADPAPKPSSAGVKPPLNPRLGAFFKAFGNGTARPNPPSPAATSLAADAPAPPGLLARKEEILSRPLYPTAPLCPPAPHKRKIVKHVPKQQQVSAAATGGKRGRDSGASWSSQSGGAGPSESWERALRRQTLLLEESESKGGTGATSSAGLRASGPAPEFCFGAASAASGSSPGFAFGTGSGAAPAASFGFGFGAAALNDLAPAPVAIKVEEVEARLSKPAPLSSEGKKEGRSPSPLTKSKEQLLEFTDAAPVKAEISSSASSAPGLAGPSRSKREGATSKREGATLAKSPPRPSNNPTKPVLPAPGLVKRETLAGPALAAPTAAKPPEPPQAAPDGKRKRPRATLSLAAPSSASKASRHSALRLAAARKEIEALSSKLTEANRLLLDTQKAAEVHKADAEGLRAENAKLRERDNVDNVIKLEAELEAVLEKLDVQKSCAADRENELLEKVAAAELELASAQRRATRELASVQRELEAVQREFNACKELKLPSLQSSVERLTAERDMFGKRCKSQDLHIAELKRKLEEAQRPGREEAQHLQAERDEARQEAERLAAELATAVKARDAAEVQAKAAAEEGGAAVAKAKEAAAKEAKDAVARAEKKASAEVAVAERERDRARGEARRVQQEKQAAEAEAKALKEALTKSEEDAIRNIRRAAKVRDEAIAKAKAAEERQADAERLLQEVMEQQSSAAAGPATKKQRVDARAREADEGRKRAEASSAALKKQVEALEREADKRETQERRLRGQVDALRESQADLVRRIFAQEQAHELGKRKGGKRGTQKLPVRRGSVLEDAFAKFANGGPPQHNLANPFGYDLEVTFEGEAGVDRGGLSREFFKELFKEALATGGEHGPLLVRPSLDGECRAVLPAPCEEAAAEAAGPAPRGEPPAKRPRAAPEDGPVRTRSAGPASPPPEPQAAAGPEAERVERGALGRCRFFGAMLARAVATYLLDPAEADPLPHALVPLLPLLAGRQPRSCSAREALAMWGAFLDPGSYKGVRQALELLEEADGEPPEGLSLAAYLRGAPAPPPGVAGGSDDPFALTVANKEALVKWAAQWQLVDSRAAALRAMQEGFRGALRRGGDAGGALAPLAPADLDRLVGGGSWTPDALIRNLCFHDKWAPYRADRELLERWLFDALRAGDVDSDRFAAFAGRAHAPASGQLAMKIALMPLVDCRAGVERIARAPHRLPRARTCADEVDLPGPPGPEGGDEAERRRLLIKAVNTALENGGTFDMQ